MPPASIPATRLRPQGPVGHVSGCRSHPDISFSFSAISAQADAAGNWKRHGLLTARGVKAPVELAVPEAQTLDGELVPTVTATVDRYAHNITATKSMAGRSLRLNADIRARRTSAGSASGRPIRESTA